MRTLPFVACALGPDDQRKRVDEWTSVLAHARARVDVEDGRRYVFDPEAAPTVRRLASAERECCSFLEFAFDEDDAGFAMTVTSEAEPTAQAALSFVFP